MVVPISLAILAALALLAVAYSPKALRHLAAAQLARAEGLEAYATAQASGLRYWRRNLNIAGADVAVVRAEARR